jgi:hypothetical protein
MSVLRPTRRLSGNIFDGFHCAPTKNQNQSLNNTTSARMPMSEPGKVEERLGIDMNLYRMSSKAKSGFGFRHTTGRNARLQRSKARSLKQEKFS